MNGARVAQTPARSTTNGGLVAFDTSVAFANAVKRLFRGCRRVELMGFWFVGMSGFGGVAGGVKNGSC